MNVITIDGSYGEGGGQIIRTAVSLAALTMQPLRITNIRAKRPNPGLRKQHIAGIELAGRLVDARVRGLEVGSTEVEFEPRMKRSGSHTYDIGTAGSISLVLQAVLLAVVLAPEPVELKVIGGTDVAWSPPVDYLREVFCRALVRLGPVVDILQVRRGHYPRGGGEVICRVTPSEEIRSIDGIRFGVLSGVWGISHCVRLPAHIALRQANAAEETLRDAGVNQIHISVETYPKEEDKNRGPGSGIVLWAESNKGFRIGADVLGKKGTPAEVVGTNAASQLLKELETGYAVDAHLADMLVPYLAVADGRSQIGVTRITSHLRTNLWVVRRMVGTEMRIEGEPGGPGVLTVNGVGMASWET